MVIRDKPFSDLNFAIFVRILLSLSCAVLGAVIPGFLQVDLHKKGLAVRAGGALALFIITFFFTPSVISSPQKPEINTSFAQENYKENYSNSQSQLKNILNKIQDENSSYVDIANKQNENIYKYNHEDAHGYLIENFADQICGPADKVCGSKNIIELNEKTESELKTIIGKITKSSAGADKNDEEARLYHILEGDIVKILKEYADCRLKHADCRLKIVELLDDQAKFFDMIADFADRICSNISLEGSGSAVELNGEAKAELKGLLKRFANLGIGGTGKYEETAWSGVLQKDIATILQKNVDCKLKIVDLLKDKITSTKQEDSIPHAENKAGDKKHLLEIWL